MKTYLKVILVLLACAGNVHAMQEQPEFIKIQELPKDQLIVANGAGKVENGIEYLDINAEEPIVFATYKELIDARKNYGVPYILAVVTYRQDNNRLRHSYYDANTLNQATLGNIKKMGMKYRYKIKDDKKDFNEKFVDPLTRSAIEKITYFAISPQDKSVHLIGTSDHIIKGTELDKQRLARLFKLDSVITQALQSNDQKVAGANLLADFKKLLWTQKK